MTPAERSLLITLARIVRERIAHVTFDISEINNFRRKMDEEEMTRIACAQFDTIPRRPGSQSDGASQGVGELHDLIKEAWDILLDSSKDSDRRVHEAVGVLVKVRPA